MAKKGALSMMPLDAADPNVQEYTGTMAQLAKSLTFSPEDAERDKWAAFSSGVTSPGTQSGALGRGMGAELEQRNKEKELRARYVPLVMSALNAQQLQAQQLQQSGLVQAMLGKGVENLTPTELALIKSLPEGKDLKDLYVLGKFGHNVQPGSTQYATDGTWSTAPDLKTGMYAQNGVAVPIPGAAGIQAYGGAMEEYGKQRQQAKFKEVPTNVAGQQGTIPLTGRLGITEGPNSPPTLDQFGVQQPGPPTGLQPGRPQGSVQTPAGAVQPPAPGQVPVRAPVVAPARAPGSVVPADKAAAREVLGFEMDRTLGVRAKTQRELQEAITGNAPPDVIRAAQAAARRADQDVAELSRQIQREGGAPPKSLAAPPILAPEPSAAPPGFNPTEISPQQAQALKINEGMSKDWIEKSYRPTLDMGESSKGILTNIGTARMSLANLNDKTGWGTDQKQKAAEVLASLGHKGAEKAAGNYQTFQQAVSTQMWSLLGEQKGPQTEGDAARARETLASLGKTPQANQFMLDLAQAAAERNVKRARFYGEMRPLAQQKGDVARIDNDWNEIAPSVWDAPIMRRWKKGAQ